MVTKGLTSDHMKYCELRSCAKVGGGCYLAKGSESASLPGPAAVVGEALKASEFTSVRAARMVGKVLHGEHWVKLTNGSGSASPTGPMPLPQQWLKAGEFTSAQQHEW